jgi:hypothetical protein
MCSNKRKLDGMWPGPLAAAKADGGTPIVAGGSEAVVGYVGMKAVSDFRCWQQDRRSYRAPALAWHGLQSAWLTVSFPGPDDVIATLAVPNLINISRSLSSSLHLSAIACASSLVIGSRCLRYDSLTDQCCIHPTNLIVSFCPSGDDRRW